MSTGLPKGVLSVLHGSVPAVKFLCEEPRIKAISFVGSDRAGKYIYDTAGALGKRVQANLGAKSKCHACLAWLSLRWSDADEMGDRRADHCILMPDANRNFALNSIVGAAFGGACPFCGVLGPLADLAAVCLKLPASAAWLYPSVSRTRCH